MHKTKKFNIFGMIRIKNNYYLIYLPRFVAIKLDYVVT